MGTSTPPSAPFGLVDSFARLDGGELRVVLDEPTLPHPEEVTEAVLRRGDNRVRGTARLVGGAGAERRRLVATFDRGRLDDGTWVLRLRGGTRGSIPTRTRVLVQGRRPVVLLWGDADPDSRLPEPRPR